MHRLGSGLLDLVLENTLSEYKKGWSCFQEKADQLVLAPKWCLTWEGGSEFYELIFWIRFVAKCFNMIADPSLMNSVTGSHFSSKVLKYLTGYTPAVQQVQGRCTKLPFHQLAVCQFVISSTWCFTDLLISSDYCFSNFFNIGPCLAKADIQTSSLFGRLIFPDTGISGRHIQRAAVAGWGVFQSDRREGPQDLHHSQRPPHPVEDPVGLGGSQAIAVLLLCLAQGRVGCSGKGSSSG